MYIIYIYIYIYPPTSLNVERVRRVNTIHPWLISDIHFFYSRFYLWIGGPHWDPIWIRDRTRLIWDETRYGFGAKMKKAEVVAQSFCFQYWKQPTAQQLLHLRNDLIAFFKILCFCIPDAQIGRHDAHFRNIIPMPNLGIFGPQGIEVDVPGVHEVRDVE